MNTMQDVSLKCGMCGLRVGPEIFECSKRPDNCPYSFKSRRAIFHPLSVIMLLFALPVSCAAVILAFDRLGWSHLDLVGAAWFLVVLIVIFSLFNLKTNQLHNHNTSASWRHISFWPISILHTVATDLQDVNNPEEKPVLFAHPPSVASLLEDDLKEKDLANHIFMNTVAGLFVQNMIGIRFGRRYRALFNGPFDHGKIILEVIVNDDLDQVAVAGVLERRIMKHLMSSTNVKKGMARTFVSGQGITPNKLVRGAFQKERRRPWRWLINLVREDAVARGLGTWKGFILSRRFEKDINFVTELMSILRPVNSTIQNISDSQEEVIEELYNQISSGIHSMVYKPEPSPNY